MVEQEAVRLRELLEKATPGPWSVVPDDKIEAPDPDRPSEPWMVATFSTGCGYERCYDADNADLAVAAVNALPALLDRIEALEANEKAQRRRATDAEYMVEALVNMLGPNALKVWQGWQGKGVQRVHFSWGPEAGQLSGEERAATILNWEEAAKNAVPIENMDAAHTLNGASNAE